MSDNLAVIKRVIDEHHTIGRHIKLVGDSLTDKEALTALEKAHADWLPGRMEALSETRNKLQQALSALDEGLGNHFDFEEKMLPPLLGDLLMQALLLQHRAIREAIDEAKSTVAGAKLEGLSREDLIAEESRIQQRIGNLCRMVEEHASKEEVILKMVRSALEAQG